MTSDIRYVTANGARLGYQVHAEGSGRPAALFVHGYSGRSTGDVAYSDLLQRLSEAFTVYALDLRGHGASASEVDGWSMTAVADDVAAAVRELGLHEPLYIGHSMGGFTGLYCEVRHPGTFSALCLVATAAAGGGDHADPAVGELMVAHGRNREILKGAFAPMYVHGGDGAANVETLVLIEPRVHQAYFAEYPRLSILEEIRNVQAPVLVLNGALDNVVPLAEQHRTALALPHAKEVIFTTEGHMLPRESADLAAREIIAFWRHDAQTVLRPKIAAARP
jgi:pimeloyl-ACP methyl ester carboxylesterase